jgi:hypothetical protein
MAEGMDPNKDGSSLWIQNLTKKNGDGGWATRYGFGLLARVDSSLTTNKISAQQDMGISRVLGIHSFYTPWGKQVLALVRNQAWLGDTKDTIPSKFGVVYSLMVYDTTYGTTQEHTLHRHTSDELGKQNWQKHGHYNTDVETDRQQWVDAGSATFITSQDPVDREEAWFTEPMLGNIIFGTPRLGAWVYTPAVPTPLARTQANTTAARESAPPTSEDGLCVPLVARRSYLEDEGGYSYFTTEEFGRPTAATVVGNRIAYAVGDTILWSSPENPAAVVTENVDVFEEQITALGSVVGVLYVFTANKTYLLSPASGFIVSGGDLRLVSGEVGCLSPASVSRYGSTLAIAHTSGIYVVDGSTSLALVSAPLNPLFDGQGLESPWTQFAQQTMTGVGANLPQVYFQLNDQTSIGANLTTDDSARMFFTLPVLGLSFILEGGQWHVWNYATLVNNDDAVLATNNLPAPRLSALGDTVFMVSGPTTQVQTYQTVGEASTSPNRSIAFLQLGYGGSLDRNSGFGEDKRYTAGEYDLQVINLQAGDVPRDRGYFYLEPPEVIPPGTILDWAGVTIGAAELAFYIPVKLVVPKAIITYGATNVTDFYFSFRFDNTNFEPLINANAGQVYEPVYRMPVERLSAQAAYSLGVATNATPQGAIVFDTGTGLPDPLGNEIRVYVDSAWGGAWTGHPQFNFQRRIKNPIMSLAFKSKGVSGAISAFFMTGITGSVTDSSDIVPVTAPTGMIIWRDTTVPVRYDWNENASSDAQAVDWMLHGAEVSAEEQMLRAQGVTLRSYSSGQSTENTIGSSYPAGVLNLAMSASRKGLSGQTTDITPPNINSPGFQNGTHDPLVARLGNPVTQAVFNGAGTWGDDADSTKGNFLIADTPVDRLTISGRMAGDAFRVTLYGHIRDKAERFKVYATAIVARVRGGSTRRRGR